MTRKRDYAAAFLFIIAALGIVLAGVDSAVFDLERYLVPKALVLHTAALGLLLLGFPDLRATRWGTAERLLAAFVLWSLVATVFATNHWIALPAWGVCASSLVVFLAARDLARTQVRGWILGGLLLAAVGGAGLGVAQAYGLEWSLLADTRPPGGTFGNRNFLAHFSMLAVAPLGALALTGRRKLVSMLAMVGLAVVVAAAVLTRSRAAWLGGLGGFGAAGVTLIVAAMADRRRRAASPFGSERASGQGLTAGRSVFVGLTLAAAVAVAVLLPNRLNWTTDSPYTETLSRIVESGEGSGRGRIIQYKNSLGLLKSDPLLGVGPGNWFVQYPRVTTDGDPSFAGHLSIPTNPWPSSDWVAFLTERGPIGAALLLAAGMLLVGRTIKSAWRPPRSGFEVRGSVRMPGEPAPSLDPDSRTYAEVAVASAPVEAALAPPFAVAAVVGILVAALVMGMFDAVLLLAAPSFFVWTIVGLLLPDPARPREWTPSPGLRRSLRLGAVALIVLLIAEASLHTAAIVTTRSSRSRATLAAAVRFAPGDHRLQLLLGERGSCPAARRAASLLPHHASAQRLARGCG